MGRHNDRRVGLHNAPAALVDKIGIRQHAIEYVGGARATRVFDAFSGRGEMFSHVWKDVAFYEGCDITWSPKDPGRRFIGENRVVMRAIDLGRFNVFDFDAFGSPWEQMLILAARRKWTKRERGAVILTDGTALSMKLGGHVAQAMAELCNIDGKLAPKQKMSETIQRHAIHLWCERAGVRIRKMWRAQGNGSGNGAARMTYTCIGFEG